MKRTARGVIAGWIGWSLALGGNMAAVASPLDLRAEFERALADFDEGQRLQPANPEKARQKFRAAAQGFGSIAAAGVVNGRLEFNLGNCYLQAGDVGRAILHYRRAEATIPRDPWLADNLALARSRCVVQLGPTRRDDVLRSLLFWHYGTSEGGRIRSGLLAYVTAFVLLTVRAVFSRRSLTVTAAVCGLWAVACAASVLGGRWSERNAPSAVITGMDVVVWKGPGTGYQRQFEQPLQPGVECRIREQRGPWWRIELADGKSGWIESTTAEQVHPPADLSFTLG